MRPTAVIITFNEENIIAETLTAIKKVADRIVILDSFSDDRTCDIGETFGAEIFKRRFDDYSTQRNFALSLVETSNWILMLDADEILSDELILEIQNLSEEDEVAAYYLKRVDVFCGKELKYASENLYFPRLFRRKQIVISRSINEVYRFTGRTKRLKGVILHHSFHKGIQDWMSKHVRYAYMESKIIGDLSDTQNLRQFVKRKLYRSPLKIFILFFYYVIFRRGFLDGSRGLLYVFLKLSYERNITLFRWHEKLR